MIPDEKTRITQVRKIQTKAEDEPLCLVQIYGDDIGIKVALTEKIYMVGREFSNDIVIDKDSVSRQHAKIEVRGADCFISDLNSTNGTYVNDNLIREYSLGSGDLIKIGDHIYKFLSGGNIEAAYHEEIYRLTITDGLTQIHNKRALLEFMDREIARANRYQRDFSILIFDIDHFKKINDTYGHLTGDYVLKTLASIIKGRIRREEMFARYGGEEFVIVLPETGCKGAVSFAEQIRSYVEEHTFEFDSEMLTITISIGVAQLEEGIETSQQLIAAADKLLYQAKNDGRNKVVG